MKRRVGGNVIIVTNTWAVAGRALFLAVGRCRCFADEPYWSQTHISEGEIEFDFDLDAPLGRVNGSISEREYL